MKLISTNNAWTNMLSINYKNIGGVQWAIISKKLNIILIKINEKEITEFIIGYIGRFSI